MGIYVKGHQNLKINLILPIAIFKAFLQLFAQPQFLNILEHRKFDVMFVRLTRTCWSDVNSYIGKSLQHKVTDKRNYQMKFFYLDWRRLCDADPLH